MVDSALTSSRPTEAQPIAVIACPRPGSPATKARAPCGPHIWWPHWAVGMQSAWHSAIGLPRRSSIAASMLGLVIPPEVSRSFMESSGVSSTAFMVTSR